MKVDRARSHIEEIARCLKYVEGRYPPRLENKLDMATGLYSIVPRINASMPSNIPCSTGDAVHNLSAALDYLTSTVFAKITGNWDKRITFPAHETEKSVRAQMDNNKLTQIAPDLCDMIMNDIKPWKDGNFPIWAIGKMDNTNKHRMLLMLFGVYGIRGASFWTKDKKTKITDFEGESGFKGQNIEISIPDNKHPFIIKNHGYAKVNVSFAEKDFFFGQPVVETLNGISDLVSSVIDAFETHFKRG